MQDVVPPNDRSIRNIPLPAHRKRHQTEGPVPSSTPPRRKVPPPQEPRTYEEVSGGQSSRIMWFLAVALVGVLIAVGAAMLFEGATVTVMPRKAEVSIPENMVARSDAPLGTLPFTTATASAEASRTVAATGERDVARQSSGAVVISNTYSTAPQRLIKNTRFEAPDGKIYRINESVVVPGAKKNANGTFTAGTVAATIFADSAGPDYDRGVDTYTIPGFKGDPRYEKFSAKGTSPVSGGFIGKEKVIPDADRKAAEDGIRAELTETLAKSLGDAAPTDRMLIAGSISYSFVPVADTSAAGASEATIKLKGTAVGALIKEADLASAIAKVGVPTYNGESLRFADRSAVTIRAKEPVTSDSTELSLAAEGSATLIWQFDPAAIQKLLAGISEDSFAQTLQSAGPAIADGTASFKPFWKHTFPKDPADIRVKVGEPTEAK